MRAAALGGLARTDADTSSAVISGLDPDPHWSVRAALARRCGRLGAERAEPRLTVMLEDEDQRVIPRCCRASGARCAPAMPRRCSIERLRADDPVVRRRRPTGWRELKAAGAARRWSHALRARRTSDRHISWRARRFSARWLELDPAAARPLLDRALGDRDWAVRVRAAALLRGIDPAADRRRRCGRRRRRRCPSCSDLTGAVSRPTVSPMAYIDTEKGMNPDRARGARRAAHGGQLHLAGRRGFLGDIPFHRVVPDFVAQDGDPRGDGEGGPGYTIRDEINQRPYLRGTVGMALDWERHRRQPVLHHALAAAAPRRPLHGVRAGGRGHGRGRSAAAVGSDPDRAGVGRRDWMGGVTTSGSWPARSKKRGDRDAAPSIFRRWEALPLLRLLGLLGRLLAFFAIGLIPPFRLGYAEGGAAPPRCLCRLALSSRCRPSRLALRVRASRAPRARDHGEKVGQSRDETAPCKRLAYFFLLLGLLGRLLRLLRHCSS